MQDQKVVFLILYINNILLIENDVGELTLIEVWLVKQFQMKDLGEVNYVLGVQIIKRKTNKKLALS